MSYLSTPKIILINVASLFFSLYFYFLFGMWLRKSKEIHKSRQQQQQQKKEKEVYKVQSKTKGILFSLLQNNNQHSKNIKWKPVFVPFELLNFYNIKFFSVILLVVYDKDYVALLQPVELPGISN